MTLNVLAKIEPALAAQGGSPRTAMRATSCSVSRSVEEAALDPEWPGPPICNYKQTTLQLVKRPPPPSVQKSERQISAQCVLNTHRISHLITGMRRSLQRYQKFQQV